MSEYKTPLPPGAIPYVPTGMCPVFTDIPLHFPLYNTSNVIGYEAVNIEHPEEHYWIKVRHRNIISKRLYPGDLILVHSQKTAAIGQKIVGISAKNNMPTIKKYQDGDIVFGVLILISRKL